MTLRSGCNAVDAGARIPNLRDQFNGSAPDLGAHETGHAAATYGPRSTSVPPTVTLTSPAWGATVTAPVTVALAATAADADGGIARVDFYVDGIQVATDATPPFAASWTTSAAGSYVLTAVAIDDEGLSASSSVTIAVNATGPPVMPGDWSAGDIGGVGVAGQTSMTDGTWTVSASGTDIWSSADAFRFVSQPLSGDGAITVRVTSLAGADPWVKAGIMIREDLNPGSRHGFLFLTPGANGLAFQRRVQTGGATAHTSGGAAAVPQWLRLLRTGSTVIAQRSGDGVNWVTVGTDSIAMATTVHVGLALTSHDNSRLATATYDSLAVATGGTPAVPDLPGGWVSQDIGATGAAGTSGTSQGRWTISGAGADVWGTADAFHFAAQPLAGDGEIVARVASAQRVNDWTKAGVMIRASTAAGSAHAFMLATPTGVKGLAFQRRAVAGGVSTHTAGGCGVPPVWVRLTRAGNIITAYRSADGVAWSLVGSDTIVMAATVNVGLAVSSHDNATLATATFDQVRITAAAP
jgi:regulation of enolase protein 1 (concanavalin A-like superfamily)